MYRRITCCAAASASNTDRIPVDWSVQGLTTGASTRFAPSHSPPRDTCQELRPETESWMPRGARQPKRDVSRANYF